MSATVLPLWVDHLFGGWSTESKEVDVRFFWTSQNDNMNHFWGFHGEPTCYTKWARFLAGTTPEFRKGVIFQPLIFRGWKAVPNKGLHIFFHLGFIHRQSNKNANQIQPVFHDSCQQGFLGVFTFPWVQWRWWLPSPGWIFDVPGQWVNTFPQNSLKNHQLNGMILQVVGNPTKSSKITHFFATN